MNWLQNNSSFLLLSFKAWNSPEAPRYLCCPCQNTEVWTELAPACEVRCIQFKAFRLDCLFHQQEVNWSGQFLFIQIILLWYITFLLCLKDYCKGGAKLLWTLLGFRDFFFSFSSFTVFWVTQEDTLYAFAEVFAEPVFAPISITQKPFCIHTLWCPFFLC